MAWYVPLNVEIPIRTSRGTCSGIHTSANAGMALTRVVHVCRTCDRNAPPATTAARAGTALATTLRGLLATTPGADWDVREVACLNGCLKPCNVAFRGPDRYSYRFSRITPADLPQILAFGDCYWRAATGEVAEEKIPEALRAKLTVRTPPRGHW